MTCFSHFQFHFSILCFRFLFLFFLSVHSHFLLGWTAFRFLLAFLLRLGVLDPLFSLYLIIRHQAMIVLLVCLILVLFLDVEQKERIVWKAVCWQLAFLIVFPHFLFLFYFLPHLESRLLFLHHS